MTRSAQLVGDDHVDGERLEVAAERVVIDVAPAPAAASMRDAI